MSADPQVTLAARETVTVTLNAAVDTTLILPGNLRVGESQTARSTLRLPGGKGVNVARVLHRLGRPVRATGLYGGPPAGFIAAGLAAEGIVADFIAIAGASRTNVALMADMGAGSRDPRVTEINEPGPTVTVDEATLFLRHIAPLLLQAGSVVLSGSLPPGLPDDYYASIVARARVVGVPVVLDTSGRGFKPALAARPLLVKPNRAEAAAAVGQPVKTIADALEAATSLRHAGAAAVAITLGAEGAVLATETGAWRARVTETAGMSAVGSGDAFLAGLLAGLGRLADHGWSGDLAAALNGGVGIQPVLALAVACGAANTLRPGAGMLEPDDVARLERSAEVTRLTDR